MFIKQIILIIFPFLLVISSCSTRRYYQAGQLAVMPSFICEPNNNEGHDKYYVGLDIGNAMTFHGREENYIIRSHYLWLFRTKKSESNLGLTLYNGRYSVLGLSNLDGDYNYLGIGPQISTNAFISSMNIDLGLGIYCAYIFELGDYLQFRKDANDIGGIYCDTNIGKFLYALYPILKIHSKNNAIFSIQCGIGNPGILSPSLAFHLDNFTVWASLIPITGSSSYDNIYRHGNFTFGAGYKF